jgi:signal peptidase II
MYQNEFFYEEVNVFSWFKILFIENEGMAWGTEIPGEYGKLFLTVFRIDSRYCNRLLVVGFSTKNASNYLNCCGIALICRSIRKHYRFCFLRSYF